MPRERVHWEVVVEATKQLPTNTAPKVKECLQKYQAEVFVGALLHDAPYYLGLGKDPFCETSDVLHGRDGEDTFLPLFQVAEKILLSESECNRERLWAFLLGMYTHAVTDIQFHPAVYYFTGNYNDPDEAKQPIAQAHHRLFEVHLDSFFRSNSKSISKELLVADYVGQTFEGLSEFMTLLAEVCSYEDGKKICGTVACEKWQASLLTLARCQKLFLSSLVGGLLRVLNVLTAGAVRGIEALCSTGRRRPQPFFEKPMEYRNPVTGAPLKKSVFELRDEAISDCVEIFKKFEPLVSGKSLDVQGMIGEMKGASLNVGLLSTPSSEVKFTSAVGCDLPGLRKQS